jgi:hypothetical protein
MSSGDQSEEPWVRMSDPKIPEKIRVRDFKIGQFHGKPKAKKSRTEVSLQRNLFTSQVVTITRSRKDKSIVRIFAYEMPLGYSRNWCVDLVGYDQNHNLYLIELKRGKSAEKLDKVVGQINRYADIVNRPEVKAVIESEFRSMYHFPAGFMFGRTIKKVILAPRKFFQGKKQQLLKEADGIECLFIKTEKVLKWPIKNVDLRVWRPTR